MILHTYFVSTLLVDVVKLESVRIKKFLGFFFSFADTICLMESTRQALFPASRRTILKSFEGVFAKSVANIVASELGRLVLPLLASKSFDRVEANQKF